MAKRLMMVMLFVGAIGMASLATSSTAEARGCYRGGGWGGHYHSYGPVYRSNYYGGGFYAPRQSFYGGGPYWGGGGYHYGAPRGGVYIRF